jgi:hypothetical protein
MLYITIPESIATPLAVAALVLLAIAFGYMDWWIADRHPFKW